ncbi:hypothetical protein [uncultured Roseivirga sp.]|uniref:hypothetical protein n=1 Tax=uncultured Roseivirga sp. TaxID=543088 RepID=UPI0030D82891
MAVCLLLSILITSCHGSRVSGNGFFDSKNEVLKEALIGQWEASGDEKTLFQFSEVEKEIKLTIDNEERPMFDFVCDGDIRFSFGYENEEKDTVFVAAQFKTYDMKTLVCLQSPQVESSLEVGLIRLNRRVTTKEKAQ